MGYHLQPGGLWKNEVGLCRKEDFQYFDFTKPRNLNELRPVRTQEFALTDRTPQFMMKAPYDVARRTLSQHTLIRLDKPDAPEDAEEAPAEEPPPEEAPPPVAGGSPADPPKPDAPSSSTANFCNKNLSNKMSSP